MPVPRRRHPYLGFTLLELSITLAIIGILVAAAVPIYKFYIDRERLRGAAESLYQHLLEARSEALKRQANIVFVLQAGGSWCYGATTTSSCDCASSGACNLGQVSSTTYPGVSFNIASGTFPLTFSGNKGSINNAVTVEVSNSQGTITLEANTMGSLSICSDNVQGYPAC